MNIKRVLLGIVAALVLLVVGILVAASFQPRDFRIERSISTTASAPAVYAIISDLNRFNEWSPWHKLDPAMKVEITGAPGSIGATQSWEGNNQVGSGRMTVVGLQPDKRVDLKLEFFKPFAATNTGSWRIDEADGQRRVTWTMDGRNDPLMTRVICLFMDMDAMVGKDFEAGLSSLKAIAEKPAAK